MWFRRAKPASVPEPVAPQPANRRRIHRVRPLPKDEVRVRCVAQGVQPVEARLYDLTLSGAGVRIEFQDDPCLAEGALVELRLEHVADGWQVDTPARVIYVRQADDLHVQYGFEFVNVGNLYGQMDNAWSHYFNRRAEPHFGLDLDAPMMARLRQHHQRVDAVVTNVSAGGMCLRVPHSLASQLALDEPAQLFFSAWDLAGEVELEVTLLNRRRLGEYDFLGLAVSAEQPERARVGYRSLLDYVARRQRELEAREAALRRSAAA
ncbi:MAG: PilZ domain-containing protein [Planctomycetes bacterium]|nr:PilZ domain-containing protein [Planctomycetota bacterium]